MTPDEKALLLATARILRAHLDDAVRTTDLKFASAIRDAAADRDALDEALKPFGPSDAEPVNEEGFRDGPLGLKRPVIL